MPREFLVSNNTFNLATLTTGDATSTVFSGVIGDGLGQLALTKVGTGTRILTGENTYSGGNTINGGTLQLGGGGTTGSIGGDVTNNGILVFDRSNDWTFGSAMSGTGELQQIGTGVTTLAGNTSHTGRTMITGDTLRLGDGGTTGSVVGDMLNDSILAIDRSNEVTLGGLLSGTGELQQNGTGVTTLTSDNTYTGGPSSPAAHSPLWVTAASPCRAAST